MKLQPQTSFSSNLHALHFFLTYRDNFSNTFKFQSTKFKRLQFYKSEEGKFEGKKYPNHKKMD